MHECDDAKPVQTPLTLVMTIKSEEDAKALQELLAHVHSLPPEQNPIVVALEEIGTVHFARFTFLEDNTKLAVITTFDGPFERYILDFVNSIGHIFDKLLAHMADAPPLPVREHRQEFLQYVRDHDLPSLEPFYSAYPKLTVLTIKHLAAQGS